MKSKKQETPVKNRRLDGYVIYNILILLMYRVLYSSANQSPCTRNYLTLTATDCLWLYLCSVTMFRFVLSLNRNKNRTQKKANNNLKHDTMKQYGFKF